MTIAPDFEQRVRDSFARQPAMRLIGAELVRVEQGEVEIVLPFRPEIAQQHGFVHAAIAVAHDGREKLVSTMSATVMTIRGRDGVVD